MILVALLSTHVVSRIDHQILEWFGSIVHFGDCGARLIPCKHETEAHGFKCFPVHIPVDLSGQVPGIHATLVGAGLIQLVVDKDEARTDLVGGLQIQA